MGVKKLAYKPTMKPGWDEVSLNSGGCRWSTQKIGPPEGDVAAGSPKGKPAEESGKLARPRKPPRTNLRRRGQGAARRRAAKPSGSQANTPLSHGTVKPSNPRAAELVSCQVVNWRAVEPKSRQAVDPSIRRSAEPLSRRAIEPLIANHRTTEPLSSCATDRQAIEPLSHQAGEPSRRRPLNHRAVEPSSRRAVGQSSRQAVEPSNHQAIQPSSRQAGEPSSRQLASRQAEWWQAVDPSSRRSAKPLSRRAVGCRPSNH